MMTLRTFLFLGALGLFGPGAAAQDNFQVVTKKIEKAFPYRAGTEVNIEGEKADVNIETWDRNEIGIQLELSARHLDRGRAVGDLEAMHYQAERVKDRIYLRNYLSPAEGAPKPESIFEARYTIRVPEDCPVYLKNQFGEASISNLANRLRINSAFTKLALQNIEGLIDIDTRFGDLTATRLDGTMTVNARRSNITLQEIKGRYDIRAHYGVLRIFADQHLADLRIDAEKSEVFLYATNPQLFAFNIQTSYSDLNLPNEMEFKFLDSNASLKKATFRPREEYFANITLTLRFGELTVGKK